MTLLEAALVGYQLQVEELEARIAEVRRRLKPRRARRRRSGPRPRSFWTAAELEVVRGRYANEPTDRLAQDLGRSASSVYQAARKLGLWKSREFLGAAARAKKLGAATRFRKGHVPANKGLRRPGWYRGRMRETQFKKGQRTGKAAENWCPIGTIRPDAEGYLRIKVREAVYGVEACGFGNTNVWPLLQRHVWEQHHGPIPPSHTVCFKDRDRSNCAITNLELVSRADLARRNSMWSRYPRELAEAIQLNGALKRKLRRLSNGTE